MIFKVQKRPRRVNGKRVLSTCYYLRYRFGDMLSDKWISLQVTDKEVAEKKASEFKREWEAEQAGILLPKPIRESAKRDLPGHLKDYLADLERRGKAGRRRKGVKQTESRLRRLFQECGWKYPVNITPDTFMMWRIRQDSISPNTLNQYLQGLNTFLNWLQKNQRIQINPIALVEKIEVPEDTRRARRAFSDDELRRLIQFAPLYRGISYLTAARTGLRFGELRELEWRDVRIDCDSPHVNARPSITKNGKEARIPLVKELQEALRSYKPADAEPTDKVFRKGIPRPRTLKKDLAAASIPYRDETGRYADFHSLRYTWGTFLQRNGVNSRTAMELMRHSDRKLTDKIYTDSTLLPLSDAVRNLPPLGEVSQICAQKSVIPGQNVTQAGENENSKTTSQVVDFEEPRAILTNPVAGGQVVRAARIELALQAWEAIREPHGHWLPAFGYYKSTTEFHKN